ncbi:hypothetical protein RintRC_1944 [Richelia intracellularis]|nr:hypothetical protein RintRC_1944 [Richelia intracellularis]
MPPESTDLFSSFQIPQFDIAARTTTTNKGFTIWANGDEKNAIRMTCKDFLRK